MADKNIRKRCFNVCITILEARKLEWENKKTFVLVEMDGKKKATNVRPASDCPFYNEYFVFDVYSTFRELLDKDITITVCQPHKYASSIPKMKLGSIQMDIGFIWNQKDHTIHKWFTITSEGNDKGFLKCDIKVVLDGEQYVLQNALSKSRTSELQLSSNVYEANLARYIVRIYRAGDLMKHITCTEITRKNSAKCYIKLSFMGNASKTSQIKTCDANPTWNEEFVFFNFFPPTYHKIKLCLFVNGKLYIEQSVLFDDICDDSEKGFLPTFGPCYTYSYSPHNQYYGYLLTAIETKSVKTIVADKKGRCQVIKSEVPALDEDGLWKREDFVCFCVIYDVSMLENKSALRTLKVTLSVGKSGFGYDDEDTYCATKDLRTVNLDKDYKRLKIQNRKPCIFTIFSEPDIRHRLFLSNTIAYICYNLESNLTKIDNEINAKLKMKLLRSALKQLKENCDAAPLPVGITELDRQKIRTLSEYLVYVSTYISKMQKQRLQYSSIEIIKALRIVNEKLKKLMRNPQGALPSPILCIYNEDTMLYTSRIQPEDILYANEKEFMGSLCGKINTIFLHKCCGSQRKAVKLDALLWMGLKKQLQSGINMIASGYEEGSSKIERIIIETTCGQSPCNCSEDCKSITVDMPTSIYYSDLMECTCYAYIYQGYFEPDCEHDCLYNPLVKVIAGNKSKKTKVETTTLHPVWSETLLIRHVTLFGNKTCCESKPPVVILEVWDHTKKKHALIGSNTVVPYLALEEEMPKKRLLEWVPIKNNSIVVGKLLVLIYFIQDTEECDAIIDRPLYEAPVVTSYRLEVVFWGLRGLTSTSKEPGDCFSKPHVEIKCNELSIVSNVIEDIHVFPNFDACPVVMDVELPLCEQYSPPMFIRVMDSKWFGMKNCIGCCLIENVHRSFYVELPVISDWQNLINSAARDKLLKDNNVIQNESHEGGFRNGVLKNIIRVLLKHIKNACRCPWKCFKKAFKYCGTVKYNRTFRYESLHAEMSLASTSESDLVGKLTQTCLINEVKRKHFDWWTKYFTSKQEVEKRNTDRLYRELFGFKMLNYKDIDAMAFEIYDKELEFKEEFNKFEDCLRRFPVYQNKTAEGENQETCTVKMAVLLYKWPMKLRRVTQKGNSVSSDNGGVLLNEMPVNRFLPILLRVYIVHGFGLHPVVSTACKPNAYIVISTSMQSVGNSSSHVKHDINPCFGQSFELEIAFPHESEITVKVMNYDPVRANDLIGLTKIDIENRYYSKHMAKCGLQTKFELIGYNMWRGQYKPREILMQLCCEHNLPKPLFIRNRVYVGGKVFIGPSENIEELALTVLLQWEKIPIVGRKLVREHVETRTLYHPNYPGISKGSLEMWVDMFDCLDECPAPLSPLLDITPRLPVDYELRVVIKNVSRAKNTKNSWLSKKVLEDIYVKGWIIGESDVQSTDVHYRSKGIADFNWRFVFSFQYSISELCVLYNDPIQAADSTCDSQNSDEILKKPAKLNIQVWIKEQVNYDVFVGSTALELCSIPKGSDTLFSVTKYRTPKIFNLFEETTTGGWWPVYNEPVHKYREQDMATAYVLMDLELITKESALMDPVGCGRDGPEPLEVPLREKMSMGVVDLMTVTPYERMLYKIRSITRSVALFTVIFSIISIACVIAYFYWDQQSN